MITMSFAAAVLVKATLITLAGLAVARVARRTRAAVRHVLLSATFAVLLALPLASIVAPSIALPLRVAARLTSWQKDAMAVTGSDIADVRGRPARGSVAVMTGRASRSPSWSALGAAIWAFGAVLFLLPVATGLCEVRRLRRTGLPWRPGQSIVDALAGDAAIRRRVDLLLHERVTGPMTCGVMRAAILMPLDAARWDADDLHRAIVHELEHVRRGDWLTQGIARAVSSLYWFHPLVWIAWRQLALEAERACDDAVLGSPSTALGTRADATEYADQLVALAQRLSAAPGRPLLAMANRSDLSARVRAVLDGRQVRGRAGTAVVGVTCAAAVLAAAAISPLRIVALEQTPTTSMSDVRTTFEVASIRPKGPFHGPAEVGVSFQPGGRLVGVNAPIYLMIQVAYGISEKQIDFTSVESKLMNEVFDIEAAAGVNALPESAPREARDQQLRQMLQSLLADRFKLAIHKETRDTPQYALVIAPNGPRLKASPAERSCPPGNRCGHLGGGPASGVRGLDVGIAELAETLTYFGDRLVLDRTGIKGKFDIDLPPWNRSSMFGPSEPNGRERAEDPNDPSIFELLPRQLGLKLDSIRGPLDMYVIDHVERPTANGAARGAAPAAERKFTAVSMKPCAASPAPTGPGGRGGAGNMNATASPGSLAIDCTTVERLIDTAYVFFGDPLLNESGPPKEIAPRLKGGPSWLRSEKFSIEAKADGGADRKTMMGPMLRAFLEERLQLQLHRDTEDMPAYALTLTKGGPKMKAIAADSDCKPRCGSVQRNIVSGTPILELGGMELEILMVVLKLDRHVIDRTGIPNTARFNVHFEYPEGAAFTDAEPNPALFRALEQQLGLRLEPIKAQHGIIVVDRVAHP